MLTKFKLVYPFSRLGTKAVSQYCHGRRCNPFYYTPTFLYTAITEEQAKKKRKPRKLKSASEKSDPGQSPTPPKRKKTTKKEVLDPPDQEVKNSPSYVPFEGITEDILNQKTKELYDAKSFYKQNSPDGRFYHLNSSTATFSFPSVTTILAKTVEGSSHFRLLNWKRKLIKEHGQERFDKIRSDLLQSGSNFHKELEARLLQSSKIASFPGAKEMEGKPSDERTSRSGGKLENSSSDIHGNTQTGFHFKLPLAEAISEDDEDKTQVMDDHVLQSKGGSQYMQSIKPVLKDVGEVTALETSIAHLRLGYMGTFDCLAEYKGTLCLIDWKTSNKPKPTLADCYDYPLQAVAYAGAVNCDPTINLKVLNVLIVLAYANGEPAHAHLINHDLCQKYWLEWIRRLQRYQTQFSEDLSEIIS